MYRPYRQYTLYVLYIILSVVVCFLFGTRVWSPCLPLRHKCAQDAPGGSLDLQATTTHLCYVLIACKSVLFSHATAFCIHT